jgi:hypothetical protein
MLEAPPFCFLLDFEDKKILRFLSEDAKRKRRSYRFGSDEWISQDVGREVIKEMMMDLSKRL